MTAAVAIADLLLSAGINYLLQSQAAQAKIAQARAENRELTNEEMEEIKTNRDMLITDTVRALDAVS